MFLKIRGQLVELIEEKPVAECGNGLMAALGAIMLAAIVIVMVLTLNCYAF